MVNLQTRSYQKELLDDDAIPFEDIKKNMQELNTVNTLLGGHQITIAGCKEFFKNIAAQKEITICEIGCGGGDNLFAVAKYCGAKSINAKFIGIDIKQECIDFAQQQYPELHAQWICSDYQKAVFTNKKPDIIFSSLFCHHFTNEALQLQLNWMKDNCSLGFFINDLHRNTIAYYSIKWITVIFSKSYLVKNDAPLSVARGFKKTEWRSIFAKANIQQYSIKWKWAFRHLIVYSYV